MKDTQREIRGYDFIPKDVEFPAIYSTEEVLAGDKEILVRYFIGMSTWMLCEIDRETENAFGWAVLNGDMPNSEWGYVSLTELEELNINGHIVHRDLQWVPKKARDFLPSDAWSFQDRL